jgi:hypothetical protein
MIMSGVLVLDASVKVIGNSSGMVVHIVDQTNEMQVF